mgnify:CR=1 FL=1
MSVIPSCPKDRKEIKAVIKQISDSKTRVEGESDYQKEAIKELAERFELDPKHIKAMATDYHKNQFEKRVGDMDEYSTLYETILGSLDQESGVEEESVDQSDYIGYDDVTND